jgi:hypothetical protein
MDLGEKETTKTRKYTGIAPDAANTRSAALIAG